MELDRAKGFVLDIDGTLVHRAGAEIRLLPGAAELLARIRESGRPFALFTNGAQLSPAGFAAEVRGAGLDVRDDELLTPLVSVQFHLRTHHPDGTVIAFVGDAARAYLETHGVRVADADGTEAVAVFVAHVDAVDFPQLEQAARVLVQGAPLLTASYAPSYAGANGPIFSRGAMVTAALAKASGAQPVVVGKSSQAALEAIRDRLGVATEELVVIGDDATMDIALGNLGGAHTILVRSGTSGAVDPMTLPDAQRPDEVVDGVAALLDRL